VCHMSSQYQLSSLNNPNNILWIIQIFKLLITLFYTSSSYFLILTVWLTDQVSHNLTFRNTKLWKIEMYAYTGLGTHVDHCIQNSWTVTERSVNKKNEVQLFLYSFSYEVWNTHMNNRVLEPLGAMLTTSSASEPNCCNKLLSRDTSPAAHVSRSDAWHLCRAVSFASVNRSYI
jgi:hypothetical protein